MEQNDKSFAGLLKPEVEGRRFKSGSGTLNIQARDGAAW